MNKLLWGIPIFASIATLLFLLVHLAEDDLPLNKRSSCMICSSSCVERSVPAYNPQLSYDFCFENICVTRGFCEGE